MRIDAVGVVTLLDMRDAFPWQMQPPQAQTDFVTNFSTANLDDQQEWHFDRLASCAYPREVFVPHNQQYGPGGNLITDNDKYLNLELPIFAWDKITLGPSNKLKDFPNRPFGYQYFNCVWSSNLGPTGSSFKGHAYLDPNMVLPDGSTPNTYGNVASQGIRFLLSRTINHKVPTTENASWEVQWRAGLRIYSLISHSNQRAQVRVSEDEGNTWKTVNAHLQLGASLFQEKGNAYPGIEGGGIPIEILMQNTSMMLTVGAQVTPYKIPGSDPRPTQPPELTGGGGSIPADVYSVGITYFIKGTAGSTPDQETALSPANVIVLDTDGGITVTNLKKPQGVTEIRAYISTDFGMQLAGSSTDGNDITIDKLPDEGAAAPPTFSSMIPVIQEVWVNANTFTQFHIEAHPIKWRTTAQLFSNPVSLGFSPDSSTPPYYLINGLQSGNRFDSGQPWNVDWPVGSVITVTTATDPQATDQQYILVLTNQQSGTGQGTYKGDPYADNTAAVTRITTKVDGLWQDVTGNQGTEITPISVTVRSQFDVGGLTIRRTCEVTVNNFHGDWSGTAENQALYIDMGLIAPDLPPIEQFTGFVDTYVYDRPSSGQAYMTMHGIDQMRFLDESIELYTPDFDGHNHYFVMHFLANYAGLTDEQIGFMDLVPPDPYSSAAGDTAPYFLPFGDGMNPWTPRAKTMTIADFSNYVRQTTGFLWYIDQFGMLQYHEWIPADATDPARVFTEAPPDSSANTGGDPTNADLTEVWNLRVTTSNREVKNEIFVIGSNPYAEVYNYFATSRLDAASVSSDAGAPRPDNFKGYKAQTMYSSPMFANRDYGERSADRLFAIERLTDYSTQFECWLQADLQPMDVIYVTDTKSGAGVPGTPGDPNDPNNPGTSDNFIPFYIMEKTDTISVMGGRYIIRSAIAGKYLAPESKSQPPPGGGGPPSDVKANRPRRYSARSARRYRLPAPRPGRGRAGAVPQPILGTLLDPRSALPGRNGHGAGRPESAGVSLAGDVDLGALESLADVERPEGDTAPAAGSPAHPAALVRA